MTHAGRRAGELKKSLMELTRSVDSFLELLDKEMVLPSTVERGRRIAALCNALNIKNDSAKHFGLGIPLEKC